MTWGISSRRRWSGKGASNDHHDQERREHYDNLTLATGVIGELKALLNALALMLGNAGSDGDIRRLIGIGQNIAETWLTSFEGDAQKLKALLL